MKMTKPNTALIAIPGKSIPPYQMRALLTLVKRGVEGWTIDFQVTSKGTSIRLARNEIAWFAYEQGYERVLMIDSDIVFEPAHVAKILSSRHLITTGIYARKLENVADPVWEIVPKDPAKAEPDELGLIEVAACGGGFLCIDHFVLDVMKTKQPEFSHVLPTGEPRHNWFFEGIVRTKEWPEGRELGEDHGFCVKAQEAGFNIVADTKCILPHVGEAKYPLNYFVPAVVPSA